MLFVCVQLLSYGGAVYKGVVAAAPGPGERKFSPFTVEAEQQGDWSHEVCRSAHVLFLANTCVCFCVCVLVC